MSKWKIDERLKREGNRIIYTDGRAAYVQTNEGEATFAVYEVAEEALELLERWCIWNDLAVPNLSRLHPDTKAFLAKHKQEERIEEVGIAGLSDEGDWGTVVRAVNQLLKDMENLRGA